MSKMNRKTGSIFTHEGGTAKHIDAEAELRRTVMACMLWEKNFYESGESVTERIASLVPKVAADIVGAMAIDCRNNMKLRHVPLLLAREMVRYPTHRGLVSEVLFEIIQRPDELSEFMALYWKDGRKPIAAQVKRGLAKAFTKFDEYQLAKYNRDAEIKLRDVLFMVHAKPEDATQAKLWKKLVDNKLETPDTWEVELSQSTNKLESWTRLLTENKLGALALLRNLRNMREAGVDQLLVKHALIGMDVSRVLPFRFIAAARHAPDFEPTLEAALFCCTQVLPKLRGKTCILVDVSGSMDQPLSAKSDMTRLDAACGLAMVLAQVCEDLAVRSFSTTLATVPARRGFALRDAIVRSQEHLGTYLGNAVQALQAHDGPFDRLVVITDEQSADNVPAPKAMHAYMINVAAYQNGVGYGPWTHIDGFSESVVAYLAENESC